MASSDAGMTSSEAPPSLEELSARGVRALLLPWIIRLAAVSPASQAPTEILVLVNHRTGSVTMIGGPTGLDIDSLLRSKDGPLPASKASIGAMPAVKVEEEGIECAICLSEFEVNREAKEMPCKHRYHPGCIEKWLGIHGSCPICRYRMPAEEEAENTKGRGGDGGVEGGNAEGDGVEERRGRGVFEVHFHIGRQRTESGSGRGESGDGSSDRDPAGSNDGSATQHMETDGN